MSIKLSIVCLDNSKWSQKVTLGGKGTSCQWSSPFTTIKGVPVTPNEFTGF